jgi:hypothetical protein
LSADPKNTSYAIFVVRTSKGDEEYAGWLTGGTDRMFTQNIANALQFSSIENVRTVVEAVKRIPSMQVQGVAEVIVNRILTMDKLSTLRE